MADYDGIAEFVVSGDVNAVKELNQIAIKEGGDLERIIYDGLVKGMDIAGAKWKSGEFFVPEVLIASRAMKSGMAMVSPLLEKEIEKKGIVVIGTVKGDVHDVGKNLVSLMLEGAGFKVIDLGTNVDKEVFIRAVQEYKPSIVGMSALLTTTMSYMKEVISALDGAGLHEKLKIMIGGAPINQNFADSIGADGYAKDAALAVEKAKEFLAA